jgi:hypothetical protein
MDRRCRDEFRRRRVALARRAVREDLRFAATDLKFKSNLVWNLIKPVSTFAFNFKREKPYH